MACPYFEPTVPVQPPTLLNARLPLIEEYQGICGACASRSLVAFAPCNHGYPSGACVCYPAGERNRANRYSLARRTAESLEIVFVTECDHSPTSSRTLLYSISAGRIVTDGIDHCASAQAAAFCRSYLRKIRRPGSPPLLDADSSRSGPQTNESP
jgi:hypothetical protein